MDFWERISGVDDEDVGGSDDDMMTCDFWCVLFDVSVFVFFFLPAFGRPAAYCCWSLLSIS